MAVPTHLQHLHACGTHKTTKVSINTSDLVRAYRLKTYLPLPVSITLPLNTAQRAGPRELVLVVARIGVDDVGAVVGGGQLAGALGHGLKGEIVCVLGVRRFSLAHCYAQ